MLPSEGGPEKILGAVKNILALYDIPLAAGGITKDN